MLCCFLIVIRYGLGVLGCGRVKFFKTSPKAERLTRNLRLELENLHPEDLASLGRASVVYTIHWRKGLVEEAVCQVPAAPIEQVVGGHMAS